MHLDEGDNHRLHMPRTSFCRSHNKLYLPFSHHVRSDNKITFREYGEKFSDRLSSISILP